MAAAQPAKADSVCVPGVADPGFSLAVDCTDPNGNGFTEASTTSSVTFTFVDPAAVASWSGNPEDILTTGYIESTTAGRSVMGITSGVAVTYVGTSSGLVGQATATGAPTLTITAPSVTLNG